MNTHTHMHTHTHTHTDPHTLTVTYCPPRGRQRYLQRCLQCLCVCVCVCVCVSTLSPFPSSQQWNGITLTDRCDQCFPTHTHSFTPVLWLLLLPHGCHVSSAMATAACQSYLDMSGMSCFICSQAHCYSASCVSFSQSSHSNSWYLCWMKTCI